MSPRLCGWHWHSQQLDSPSRRKTLNKTLYSPKTMTRPMFYSTIIKLKGIR